MGTRRSWNIERLPHRGRHPNEYHDFVLEGMKKAAIEAGNDMKKFQNLYNQYVKQPIRENPELLRKSGWK